MTESDDSDTRTLWERIWYPTEEDVSYCRAFHIASTASSMLLMAVVSIFSKSRIWFVLFFALIIVSFVIRQIALFRYSQIQRTNNRENSD